MMRRFAASYGIRFQEDGRVDVFPAVEIAVRGKTATGIRALFHIDSGATTSIVPLDDAEVLGIRGGAGKKVFVRGIAGSVLTGFRGQLTFELGAQRFIAPVIFTSGEGIPRILGREGVFARFGLLFDETKKRTAFLDSKRERVAINALFQHVESNI